MKSCPQVQDKAYMQIQSFLTEATAHEFGHGRAYSNLLLTLVNTLRSIIPYSSNSFRDEVVLPHLSVMASQVSSVWKGSMAMGRSGGWADSLAVALVETFATAMDCATSRQNVALILLPGLRCLEAGGKEFLPAHHDSVLTMIREAEIHPDSFTSRGLERNHITLKSGKTLLWSEGVVHPRAGVRAATASLLGTIVGRISEPLVVSRVAPALVTLASDPDV
ncbi:hypothetical protein J437_LFUL019585 [Ladona fulva]|nr:hypothetical protein J437_LFUL019585 [Ladona fulva]